MAQADLPPVMAEVMDRSRVELDRNRGHAGGQGARHGTPATCSPCTRPRLAPRLRGHRRGAGRAPTGRRSRAPDRRGRAASFPARGPRGRRWRPFLSRRPWTRPRSATLRPRPRRPPRCMPGGNGRARECGRGEEREPRYLGRARARGRHACRPGARQRRLAEAIDARSPRAGPSARPTRQSAGPGHAGRFLRTVDALRSIGSAVSAGPRVSVTARRRTENGTRSRSWSGSSGPRELAPGDACAVTWSWRYRGVHGLRHDAREELAATTAQYERVAQHAPPEVSAELKAERTAEAGGAGPRGRAGGAGPAEAGQAWLAQADAADVRGYGAGGQGRACTPHGRPSTGQSGSWPRRARAELAPAERGRAPSGPGQRASGARGDRARARTNG